MARRFHRTRHHFGRAASGWKGSAASAATGIGTGLALPYVVSTLPMLQTVGWWALPGAMALVGHFLKRKNPTIGGALLGIAGLQGLSAFQASRAQAKGYPSNAYADAGGPLTSYSDNVRTDAAPSMGTAQAAALLNSGTAMGLVGGDAGYSYADAGHSDAGADDAYGLVD